MGISERVGLAVAAAIVVGCAGCSGDAADAATSESFVGSAGTVVGGKDGIRAIGSQMSHDAIGLADGSAVTPIDQRYEPVGETRAYVYHALEFVSAAGDRVVQIEAPAPFYAPVAGPDGSALVIGLASGGGEELHRLSPSSPPELLAKGDIGGVTTATDGSIVWIERGATAMLHRLRNGEDIAVPIEKDPYERTFASCRTFLAADAERVYDVCISGFTLEPSDEVQRVRTFAADGSLEAEVTLPEEPFGGIITGFDGGGRLLVLDTGYTGDGDKNVGVHGYRYDPKTKSASVLSIPVFPRTEMWRPYGVVATPDGGVALPGRANERFGMVKLLADGSLDRAFDEDGAMSAKVPDDWGILVSGRVSSDGKRIDLLGFGEKGREKRTYRLAVHLP